MRTRQCEAGAVVIEGSVGPGARAVALVAARWEIRRNVIRTCGAVVVCQMARYAGGAVERVVVVLVAVSTLPRGHSVHAGQRESGSRVVELAVRPLHGIVALLAGRRETGVWDGTERVVVIGLVTADARRAGDAVVVVYVAIAALPGRNRMRSG